MMLRLNLCHYFVAFLMFSLNSVFGLDPQIYSFTSDVLGRFPDRANIVMNCRVEYMPPTASIQFSKMTPEGPVVIKYDPNRPGKYRFHSSIKGPVSKTLYIFGFRKEDDGLYRCTIKDDSVDPKDWPVWQRRLKLSKFL